MHDALTSPRDPLQTPFSGRIQHTPVGDLHRGEGATRGRAHVGYPMVPEHSPARLRHPQLLLVADGHMSPGEGVPMHAHAGIDNLTIVLEGRIRHEDHRGDAGAWIAEPGDAALMAAGAGGEHAEFVHGHEQVRALVLHFASGAPKAPCRFEHARLDPARMSSGWQLLGGHPDVAHGELTLSGPVTVKLTAIAAADIRRHEVAPGRAAYVMSLDGLVEMNGCALACGDRAMVEAPGILSIASGAAQARRVLLIDLPASNP